MQSDICSLLWFSGTGHLQDCSRRVLNGSNSANIKSCTHIFHYRSVKQRPDNLQHCHNRITDMYLFQLQWRPPPRPSWAPSSPSPRLSSTPSPPSLITSPATTTPSRTSRYVDKLFTSGWGSKAIKDRLVFRIGHCWWSHVSNVWQTTCIRHQVE